MLVLGQGSFASALWTSVSIGCSSLLTVWKCQKKSIILFLHTHAVEHQGTDAILNQFVINISGINHMKLLTSCQRVLQRFYLFVNLSISLSQ